MSRKLELEWLDPKVDFIFKKIFTKEGVLIDFLNAVLKRKNAGDKIVSVIIENPETKRDFINDKFSVLDIRATTHSGEIVNIEIQRKDEKNMVKRSLYHWSKLYGEQLVSGDNYRELKKTICINILDFEYLEEEPNFHNVYKLLNINSLKELEAPMEIHYIELPKYENSNDKNDNEALSKWIEFLNHPQDTSKRPEPALKEAIQELEVLSYDDETRKLYKLRQEAFYEGIRQLNSKFSEGREKGIEEGMEQGMEKKQTQMVQRLFKLGMPLNLIAEAAEISEKEVEAILAGKKPATVAPQ